MRSIKKKKYERPDLVAFKEKVVAEQRANRKPKKEKLVELKLKEDYLNKIMRQYILPKYPHITYFIHKAEKTNSLYLNLIYGSVKSVIRFSDHATKQEKMHSLDVNDKISTNDVISNICSRCRGLKYKSTMRAFKKIESENKNIMYNNKEINGNV